MLRTLLRFFDPRDIQKENWKETAQLFLDFAEQLVDRLPENERSKAAMTNLLNAKDDAVRAQIEDEESPKA